MNALRLFSLALTIARNRQGETGLPRLLKSFLSGLRGRGVAPGLQTTGMPASP